MRYINRLEHEKREAEVELTVLKAGLSDLRAYLCSSKFHNDTTVQVKDVLMRMDEALATASRLREEQEQMREKRPL